MSYTGQTKGLASANFLASGEGLWPVTATIPSSMGEVVGREKVVRAGTIFPANDSTAIGIVYQDVYVTNGDHAGAVLRAAKVYVDRLPEAPTSAAQSAMEKTGLVFIPKAPEIERE